MSRASDSPALHPADPAFDREYSPRQWVSSWIRLFLGFSFMALCSIPYLAVVLLLLPWRGLRIRSGNVYGKVIGKTLTYMSGTRPRIAHRERLDPSRPAIYVSNHNSELDAFLGMWLCPMGGCGVAKREVGNVPFFGWAYRLSGHLLIDRDDRERAIASMVEVAEIVRRHKLSVWIWPEGTRSRDGRLQPFKKGFAHMAITTGLPVVPVVMHNSHHRWPGRSLKMYPGELKIDVLPPVDTSTWRVETLEEHIRQVREIFLDHLGQQQPTLAK